MSESNGPTTPPSELHVSGDLPPYVKTVGEMGEDGSAEIELTLKQDPRFTEEVIAAMQGPVDPMWAERQADGGNQIELTKYLGSYAEGEGAMDSIDGYMASDEQTHVWDFKGPDGSQNIVELTHIAFPAEKHEKLKELGIQLDPTGFVLGIDPPPPEAETAEVDLGPVISYEDEPGSDAETEEARPEPEQEPEQLPAEEEPVAEPPQTSAAAEVSRVSSEGLPESVSNNYNVSKTESGLLVAESRANHSSKQHKSEQPETEADHEKQRGIIINEKEHPETGELYFVAERPDSNPSSGETSPPEEPPVTDGASDEFGDEKPKPQPQTQPAPEMPPPEGPPPGNTHEKLINYKLEIGVASGRPVKGEDAILTARADQVFAVFDGLGGMGNGREAAYAAHGAVEEMYRTRTNPPTIVEEAVNDMKHVLGEARMKVSETGGYTTAVIAKIDDINGSPYLIWANAGDSRLFIEKDAEGVVKSVSTDQSEGGNMVVNCLKPADDHGTPYTERTLSKMDEFGAIKLSAGDRIMLCTDGITGDTEYQLLKQEELQEAFDIASPQAAADRLLEMSRKVDDKSVIVIDVVPE